MSKVLYVEDHPAQRDILAQMLELNGFEVSVASDGVEGVEKIRAWLPDLILMDIRMPRMNGFEAIKITRSEEKTAHIPIIVVSAWASARHKELALAAGANEHFTKPVDLNRLLTTIGRYLKGEDRDYYIAPEVKLEKKPTQTQQTRQTIPVGESKEKSENIFVRLFGWLSTSRIQGVKKSQPQQSEILGRAFAATRHDLVGLLNIIQQDAQVMMVSPTTPDRARRVWRSARYAILLLQNLGDLRPGGSLNLEVEHLPDLIEEALDLIEPEFKGRVKVEQTYEHNLPGVYVDPLRFEQVLLNLFKNARESQADTISVKVKKDGDNLCLIISDNGEGIASVNLDHLFELWHTTRQGEGRGLGLYIVKTILDRHGWDIHVKSKPGKTCFVMLIPKDHLTEPVKTEPIASKISPKKLTKPTILIVDDNADTLDLFQETLKSPDYELETAWTLQDAVNALRDKDYDVVITDLRFLDEVDEAGGMAGLRILEFAQQANPPAQVIIVTGFGSESIAQKAIELGAYDYMAKPINFKRLQVSISKAIEARRKLLSQESAPAQLGETPHETISIIGNTPAMIEAIEKVQIAAHSNETILIRGEGGTGRSFIAESIHTLSQRRAKPFHKVNCTTLMVESSERIRNPEVASPLANPNLLSNTIGGTIFLDSIGNASKEAQHNILKFLGQLGSDPNLDVQVISSLDDSRQANIWPELYRRLSEIEIYLPPLRERVEDIPLLIGHFLRKHSLEYGLQVDISPEAVALLQEYTYPDNVVQLERVIKFAVRRVKQGSIELKHLPQEIQEFSLPDPNVSKLESLKRQIQKFQKNLFMLQERRAMYGIDSPVSLINEIDAVKEEIERLEVELNSLKR